MSVDRTHNFALTNSIHPTWCDVANSCRSINYKPIWSAHQNSLEIYSKSPWLSPSISVYGKHFNLSSSNRELNPYWVPKCHLQQFRRLTKLLYHVLIIVQFFFDSRVLPIELLPPAAELTHVWVYNNYVFNLPHGLNQMNTQFHHNGNLMVLQPMHTQIYGKSNINFLYQFTNIVFK